MIIIIIRTLDNNQMKIWVIIWLVQFYLKKIIHTYSSSKKTKKIYQIFKWKMARMISILPIIYKMTNYLRINYKSCNSIKE